MFQKIFTTSAAQLAERLLVLFTVIMITQYLGDSGKGQQTLILSTIEFILLACQIIGGASIIYLASRYSITKLIVSSYLWTLVIAFISYFVIDYLQPVASEFIFHVSLLTVFFSFTQINMNIMLGRDNINAFNIFKILTAVILFSSFAFIFFALDEKNLMSYIYSLYIAQIGMFVVSLIYIRKYFDQFSFDGFKKVLNATVKYGFVNQISYTMHVISHLLGHFIIESYYDDSHVGVFATAVMVTEALWMLGKSIATVQYARISNTDDNKASQLLTVNVTKFAVAATMLGVIVFLIIPPSVYQMIFGKDFSGVKYITLFLLPGIALHNVSLLAGHYFSGTGQFVINVYANGAALITTVAAMYLLVPTYGMVGAASSMSISFLVFAGVTLYFFKKESGIGPLAFIPRLEDFKALKEEFNKFISK
ncbi:MAG: polysaccharide biosynthesis C-terminal domain-containing protein [Flavobacteriales bacterium]|nr:polysaccharide biosynthesis C-terminal domain-containing protein [Flavobacteriales bacterium]